MPFRRPDRRVRRIGLAERVADAVVVARAGVRQRVKNVMIVRALRDGADFEPAWYAEAARAELELAAVESETDAARVQRELEHARGRHLRAVTARDYVDRDVPTLRLRRRVLLALAARLRLLAQQHHEIAALIDEARASALDEIAAATAAVPRRRGPRTLTGSARRLALADLADDLAELAAQRAEE